MHCGHSTIPHADVPEAGTLKPKPHRHQPSLFHVPAPNLLGIAMYYCAFLSYQSSSVIHSAMSCPYRSQGKMKFRKAGGLPLDPREVREMLLKLTLKPKP